ncbi:hypothetical protein KGY73_05035 [bacterium]|nr:hypothetical protein [bacterium]
MKVLKSYGHGIKEATLQPKMVFVLWVVNFLFGAVFYIMISGILSEFWGKSLAAEKLFKEFDMNYFFELMVHKEAAFQSLISVGILLFGLYFLVSIFLYGGILHTVDQRQNLGQGKRGSSKSGKKNQRFSGVFFQGAGKYFGRFFRLYIYSLILWAVFGVLNVSIHFFFVKVLGTQNAGEKTLFYLFWVRVGIGIFLLFLVLMVLDYSRIRVVVEDTRKVFRSLLQGIQFVFQKLGKTLALYSMLVVTGLILLAGYWLLKSVIPGKTLGFVLLAFLVGQVFIFARGWLRIIFQAAQMKYFKVSS